MSGLIVSLLIEPVFRQARRFSRQTSCRSPSDNIPGEPSSSPQNKVPSPGSNVNPAIVISDQENQSGLGMSAGSTGPANNIPSIFPKLALEMDGPHEEVEVSSQVRQHDDESDDSSLESSNLHYYSEAARVSDSHVGPTSPLITRPVDSNPVQNALREIRGNTQETENPSGNSYEMDEIGQSPLPENDGMGVLRGKIHAIRDKNVSSAEKARMIHELMTESYHSSRGNLDNQPLSTALSLSSPRSPARSGTPTSHGSEPSFDQLSTTPTSTASVNQQANPFNLTPEDLKPTFAPKDEPDSPLGEGEDVDTEELDEDCLGCQHYKRNIKLQCYTCKKWYTCRFCHDEVERHHLIRHKTENMLCMLCGHAQPAAQWCRECGEQAAQYYCNFCKLWDNDTKKSIYHCNDCGICRIGQGLGKDFFHCKTCSVCLPISIENTHRCIERSTQCDCPICGDYMFTSPETVVVMRCGHSIHHKCLSEYSKGSYRCPICSKTITNMESTFRNLDRTIQSQPMPAEFKDTKALIYCNDCGAKSIVKYHWLGLKCDLCESYNTAQIRLLRGDVLEPLEHDGNSGHLPASQRRPSSYGADEETLSPTLESLQISMSSAPGTSLFSQLTAPSSAEPNGRPPYSLTRGRAVSPVIRNYFGLPTNRESTQSRSSSLLGHRNQKGNETDSSDGLHFWGKKLGYTYGFLGEIEPLDGPSGANGEEDDEEALGGDSEIGEEEDEEQEDDEVEDDGDDDEDDIDIFGHR